MCAIRWIIIHICLILLAFTDSEKQDGDLTDSSFYVEDSEGSGDDSVENDKPKSEVDRELNKEYLRTVPQAYQIMYPLQFRRSKLYPSLSTKDTKSKSRGIHFGHTNFAFSVFGRVVKVRLTLNNEILSKGFKRKRHLDENAPVIEEKVAENCYYQGYVRKAVGKSYIALTTCQGLSGVLVLENDSYIIEPLQVRSDGNQTEHPHVIYKTIKVLEKSCGNDKRGKWAPYQDLHKGEFLRRLKIMRTNKSDLTSTMKRYIDLGVVMDHSIFDQMNSNRSLVWSYALQLANVVDMFLQEYGLRINLVFAEVWNMHSAFLPSLNVKETLQNFLMYRQQTMGLVNPDVAVLLTTSEFSDDLIGMAVPDSVCTDRAVAVVQDTDYKDRLQVAASVSHMIGHMIGVRHDHDQDCSCEDPFGCLMTELPMGTSSTHPVHLGSCSQRDLNGSVMAGLDLCLNKELTTEVSFVQQCGNGELERGEECDCGTREMCESTAPCCDPDTCLLKPWATCMEGDCCYNCTVLPLTQMCRAPSSECDVPEFCDGSSGQCPANVHAQNGHPCDQEESFCYQGTCHNYQEQCTSIWGPEATPSDDKCYKKFNPTGNFNGHCGFNSSSNSFIKCADEHIKCGLLHCASGSSKPVTGENKTSSNTHISSGGHDYQCKNLNDVLESLKPHGMVRDGTKCGTNKMCVKQRCVPLATVVKGTCPLGYNGKICSGYGVCTSAVKCFCYHRYSGLGCDVYTPPTTTESTLSTHLQTSMTQTNISGGGLLIPDSSTIGSRPNTSGVLIDEDSIPTLWLLIVLASVAGGAVLIMGCCLLCYRRRSPQKMKKRLTKKKKLWNTAYAPGKKTDSCSDMDSGNRVISFGNLPSYKADKIKKAMRKSVGGQSETGSEHSAATDRGSRELNLPETFPNLPSPPERGILKKNSRSGRSLDNLKKSSKHGENCELLPMRNTFDPPRHRWLYKTGLFGIPGHRVMSEGNVSPLVGRDMMRAVDTTVALIQREDLNASHSDREELPPTAHRVLLSDEALDSQHQQQQQDESFYEGLRNSYYERRAAENEKQEVDEKIYDELHTWSRKERENDSGSGGGSFSENGDCCDHFEVCSQCSCTSSIEKKLSHSGSEVCLSDMDYTEEEDGNDSKDVQTQTDELISPSSVKSSSDMGGEKGEGGGEDTLEGTKNRIKKLKNINDLLKQIDEQFNTVLKQTQGSSDCSPSPSEETRLSETEADQQYKRDSYYRQSDTEDGIPTPVSSRSSYVSSCAPSLSNNKKSNGCHRNSSRVCSSNISSPDPLPSPGCVVVSPCGLDNAKGGQLLEDLEPVFLQRHSTPISKATKVPSPIELQSPIFVAEGKAVKSPSSPPQRQSSPSRIPVLKSSRNGFSPERTSQRQSSPERVLLESAQRVPVKRIKTGSNQFSSPWIPQSTAPTSSPLGSPQSPWGREDTLPVPYRGAKTTPGSIPSSPSKNKAKPDLTGSSQLSRSMSETGSKNNTNTPTAAPRVPPRGGVLYQRQLTDPTLDGCPLKQNFPPTDIHSLSEGYHSDRAEAEDLVIVREIPTKPSQLHLRSPARNSKDISSPEDINV